MIKAYLTDMTNIDKVGCWLDDNEDTARWAMGKALIFENNNVYLSSIEFDNEEDFVYCRLKFNLKKYNMVEHNGVSE